MDRLAYCIDRCGHCCLLVMEKKMKTVKFLEWTCDVTFAKYGNDRTAIQLVDVDDRSPIATASVNVVSEPLTGDEIAIKDYSENEGMLNALVEAGIVSEPTRWVNSGFVRIPICELLVEVPE